LNPTLTTRFITKQVFTKQVFGLALLSTATIFAGGGSGGKVGGGGGETTPPNAVEVRIPSERIPGGATVQMKYLFTQPRPIGSSGSRIATHGFSVNGVSIFSPQGDAAGAAVWQNDDLSVSIISPSGDFGTNVDYPFMTVAMTIPASIATGITYDLAMESANFVGPLGPLTLTDPKPGTLTVGGSVSIHNVTPGGGIWPSGTVVKVEGTGFTPATRISAKMRMSPSVYISPTEMQFTLQDSATTMDMQAITATNSDGSQVVYYSYLRGILVQSPSRKLLTSTDPIFQAQRHALAAVTRPPALASGQFVALAIQNPSPGPVVVTFQLRSSGAATSVHLPSGGRIMDDLSVLLGGVNIPANDVVTITATSAVQILGLLGDETAGTVTPFLPAF
jgi:hypothetical protein